MQSIGRSIHSSIFKHIQVYSSIFKYIQAYSSIFSIIKVAATDMRYFAKSKFFGSLVHKKNFGLI